MMVEIVCIIRGDDGEVLQEFKVVEFEAASVIDVGPQGDGN
jgi:hypothetical protein